MLDFMKPVSGKVLYIFFFFVFLIIAPPLSADDGSLGDVMIGNMFVSIVSAPVDTGLGIAVAVNEDKTVPNLPLSYVSIGFGSLGILSGIVNVAIGSSMIHESNRPCTDTEHECDYRLGISLGSSFLIAGIFSMLTGGLALGLGIQNSLRKDIRRNLSYVPVPVVFRGKNGSNGIGFSWSTQF